MTHARLPRPSPNFGPRKGGGPIDMLIVHYTGMHAAEDALDRLCDPESRVSAHYLVDEAGRTHALVDEERRAWHAGVSCWAGERDVNSRSIGIELANPGHELGYRDFPEEQMAAFAELALDILARHAIPPHRVLGHSDVAPLRKLDPGERFDWAWCATRGIGLYPPPDVADETPAPVPGATNAGTLVATLSRFGYERPTHAADASVVTAFRRHFRPRHLQGPADARDLAIAGWLVANTPVA